MTSSTKSSTCSWTRRLAVLGLALMLALLALTMQGQLTQALNSGGANYAGTAASTQTGGVDDWSNKSNATGVDDNSCASTTLNNKNLTLTNFGFAIPSEAQITGVKVEIKMASTSSPAFQVRLKKGASTLSSPNSNDFNRPNATATTCASSDWVSGGSATDTWTNFGLTPGDVNSTAFGIQIESAAPRKTDTNFVDAARITVYYAPAAPTSLSATAISSSQINLAWTDNSTLESDFHIERCSGAGCTGFVEIATVGASTTSYPNTGLAASTLYRYRVRAHEHTDNLFSSYSNIAEATTLPPPDPPPLDTTPPVITPTVIGTLGNNGWYVSDVEVSWEVTDPESEVTFTEGCDPSTVISDIDEITFTCTATSAGGTAEESVTIKRDATPPTITGSPEPRPNANGWIDSDGGPVTATWSGDDNLSGIDFCDPPTVLTTGGIHDITGYCTDLAGNEGSHTQTVRIVVRVEIDIKPGSFPNSINLKNKGNIPVGVKTGLTHGVNFDATTIALATVRFAGASALPIGQSPQDFDGDLDLDMVYHFKTQATNLTASSTSACLTGETSAGLKFKGCDSVRIVRTGPKALQVTAILMTPNSVKRAHTAHFNVEGEGIESVQLQVFALSGKQVYASGLVEGHTLSWNLLSDQGKRLANGVYLYVVMVKGYDGKVVREVKKLVILR